MLTLGNSNQIVLLWSDMSYVHMNEKHALELLSSYVLIVKVLWRRHTRWFRRLQALRMPAGGQQVTFKIFPFFTFSQSLQNLMIFLKLCRLLWCGLQYVPASRGEGKWTFSFTIETVISELRGSSFPKLAFLTFKALGSVSIFLGLQLPASLHWG